MLSDAIIPSVKMFGLLSMAGMSVALGLLAGYFCSEDTAASAALVFLVLLSGGAALVGEALSVWEEVKRAYRCPRGWGSK